MFYLKLKKIKGIFFVFFLFFLAGCYKKGSVLAGDWLYEDVALTKKTAFFVARGERLNYKNCQKKVCKVLFKNKIKGFFPEPHLFFTPLKTVTFIKNASLLEKGDLGSKILKEVEVGTKAFLMQEDRVWSLVDLGDKRGWVLMENLYQGEISIPLNFENSFGILQFFGRWYTPFLSAERNFSLEKAFDNNLKTFSIVPNKEKFSLFIRSKKSLGQEKFKLSYTPLKNIQYKNLSLPQELIITYPEEKVFSLNKPLSYIFEGNRLEVSFTSSKKDLVYLNQFQIEAVLTSLKEGKVEGVE